MRRLLVLATLTIGSAAQAADTRPVTQDQFREVLRVFKRVIERLDRLEKRVGKGGGGAPGGEEVVDLGDEASVGNAPIATGGKSTHGSVGSGATPVFKVFFDLDFVNRPGTAQELTFSNFHSFLFFELLPTPDIQFSFHVDPNPKFYELDIQATKQVQIRLGKIWIPFDDMAPHNIFGGRVNVTTLSPGPNYFLPNVWSDLGVGAKIQVLDTRSVNVLLHAYMVNGFGSGGSDPLGAGAPYPSFADTGVSSIDNNRNKALGARLHGTFSGRFGLGASFYTGQWNDQNSATENSLSIFGADTQIRLGGTELRAGLANMSVGIDPDASKRKSFTRGGYYAELGQKFGAKHDWKAMLRAGSVQLDSRAIDLSDQQIVGATLLTKPALIEYSLEHSRDLKKVPGKTSYSYTAFRVVMAF